MSFPFSSFDKVLPVFMLSLPLLYLTYYLHISVINNKLKPKQVLSYIMMNQWIQM